MAEIGKDIDKAAQVLRSGNLVAIPTETVYGLAGNSLDESAILEIYKVKNRPKFDPLIAHTDSLEKVASIVEYIPDTAFRLAEAFWPGPLTLLLPKRPHIPDLMTSGLPQVAVRIPDHPLTTSLLQQLDFALAAPSANPFGYVSPTTAQHVEAQLGHLIPYILDGGPCQIGLESTIVGFEGDQATVYRLGGKKLEEIESITGTVQVMLNQSSNPQAPGMLKSHYAPKKELIIGDLMELSLLHAHRNIGVIAFTKKLNNLPQENQIILSPDGVLDEAAKNLFSALREMDQRDVDLMITEFFPESGLGRAINDRLKRAAAR